jgi:hypothetical protein
MIGCTLSKPERDHGGARFAARCYKGGSPETPGTVTIRRLAPDTIALALHGFVGQRRSRRHSIATLRDKRSRSFGGDSMMKLLIGVAALVAFSCLPVMPSQAKDAAAGEGLFQHCAKVRNDDTVRGYDPSLRAPTIKAFKMLFPDARGEPDPSSFATQAHYRCMGGKVPVHSHSIVQNDDNSLIYQRKFFQGTTKNRLVGPSEISALDFKHQFQRFMVCSSSATIGIDRSIFSDGRRPFWQFPEKDRDEAAAPESSAILHRAAQSM